MTVHNAVFCVLLTEIFDSVSGLFIQIFFTFVFTAAPQALVSSSKTRKRHEKNRSHY
ncbi:hypothetical protein SBV1_1610017 [Verrucomicrobia bacterium]|nr:hypothetical protein SBV1_1610017 [Verrucomicrobiota bacterium]